MNYSKYSTSTLLVVKSFLLSILVITSVIPISKAQKKEKYNVLFIAVDDLKPAIGAFGDAAAITPAMDALSKNGISFQNNHCQQAVCGATRASLLTGLRPDRTKVWDLVTNPRISIPGMISLPQHFKNNGYNTMALGKIFHYYPDDPAQDALSWSVPFNPAKKPELLKNGKDRAPTECLDVPDDAYDDGNNTNTAIAALKKYKQTGEPFFLAMGFRKPHLPFAAPKRYWDLYKRDLLPQPATSQHAKDAPSYAYTTFGEIRKYAGIPQEGPIDLENQKELIHGYYASVSYVDAQLQKLMAALKENGQYENTIIILWGDHGWHLGDHGQWTKHTNYEEATHSPLIISAPTFRNGNKYRHPTEFVDIFPTLCELTGLPIPEKLDGISLVPVMKNNNLEIKEYAVSQFPRGEGRKMMGYTLRTDRYRMTYWVTEYFTTSKAFNKNMIAGRELYDYAKDPNETINFSGKSEYGSVEKELSAKMEKFFTEQFKKINAVAN